MENLLLLSGEILPNVRGRLTSGSLLANAFRVGLFCFLFSGFLYLGGIPDRVKRDIFPLVQHPFDFTGLLAPILARRLTLPVTAHLLHLEGRRIIVIPALCSFLTLVVLYRELALAMTEILAFLSVMLLSLTTMTVIGSTWLGMPDPISNLMGVACMASASPVLITLFLVIGLQTDERFAFIIPFFLLWKVKDCASFKAAAKRLIPFAACILVAFLVTGLIQFLVVGGAVPISVYRGIFLEVWQDHIAFPFHIPMAMFFGFRWAWWLPIFLAITTFKNTPRLLALTTLFFIALESLLAMIVADMTRSMAQVFPGFILVIYILYRQRPGVLLRWLPVTILAMVITPMVDVFSRTWLLRWPLPVQLVRVLFLGHSAFWN